MAITSLTSGEQAKINHLNRRMTIIGLGTKIQEIITGANSSQTDLDTAESEIDTLQSDLNTAEADIDTAEADIVVLETKVDELTPSETFVMLDDFVYQTMTEANTPWILNSGSDAEAIDSAINSDAYGVARLTTGDADGTMAADGTQMVSHIKVVPNLGGVEVEARLKINTAITDVSVNFGLTDSTSLEEPFSIGASDTITSNATDGACFVYDTDADTDEWFACSVDSDTDDTGNATTGTAPTADTYQVLKIAVSADGDTVTYYIDGTLVATLNNAGVSPDAVLYATVTACSTTTTSKTIDVDYIKVVASR